VVLNLLVGLLRVLPGLVVVVVLVVVLVVMVVVSMGLVGLVGLVVARSGRLPALLRRRLLRCCRRRRQAQRCKGRRSNGCGEQRGSEVVLVREIVWRRFVQETAPHRRWVLYPVPFRHRRLH